MIYYDAASDTVSSEQCIKGSRNFLDAINKEMRDTVEPFVLPQGTLSFSKDKFGVIAAFQVPPRAVMTKWKIDPTSYNCPTYYNYFLSFPYIVFLNYLRKAEYSDSYTVEPYSLIYFSNSAVSDIDEPVLYNAYLPNAFCWGDECRFCSGAAAIGYGTVYSLWNRYIQYFFGSTFKLTDRERGSVMDYQKNSADKRVATLDEWSKNSLSDPSFITTVKWTGKGISLKTAKDVFSRIVSNNFCPRVCLSIGPVFSYCYNVLETK